jgi:hypothetical protein
MIRTVFGLLLLLAGAAAGVASAVAAIELYGQTPVGPGSPWQSWNLSPAASAYPYALAHYLLAGRFPPATGQLREYSAQRSDDGGVLTTVCEYTLVATPQASQWWSVAAFSSAGNGGGSNAVITADTAVAEANGSLKIVVSRNPSSGNWVRPPATGAFTLLYTVAEAGAAQSPQSAPSFTIGRSKC